MCDMSKESFIYICTWEWYLLINSTFVHTFTAEERVNFDHVSEQSGNYFDIIITQDETWYITMIQRLNLSLSNGNVITRNLRKSHISNPYKRNHVDSFWDQR